MVRRYALTGLLSGTIRINGREITGRNLIAKVKPGVFPGSLFCDAKSFLGSTVNNFPSSLNYLNN